MKSFYSLAARLPLPRYHRTLLWSRSLGPVRGNMRAWPYWRSVELALLGLQRRYDATFPDADSYSLVELGVWRGDSLELLVHYRDTLVRRLGVTKPIVVYGFDTFEGLPAARVGDEALPWEKGQFAADYQTVVARFAAHANVKLVKGLFADTLARYRDELRQSPLYVSVDCDWYSSTMDAFRGLLPFAPHGSLWYFDDIAMNYHSPLTGQMRAISDINQSESFRLVEYPLHVATGEVRHWKKLYRLARAGETAPD